MYIVGGQGVARGHYLPLPFHLTIAMVAGMFVELKCSSLGVTMCNFGTRCEHK